MAMAEVSRLKKFIRRGAKPAADEEACKNQVLRADLTFRAQEPLPPVFAEAGACGAVVAAAGVTSADVEVLATCLWCL